MIPSKTRTVTPLFALLLLSASMLSTACNSDKRLAQGSLETYMKSQGVKTVDFDSFVTSSSVPGKAYLGAIATWNFADTKGNPLKEYIGAVMAKNGNEWAFERFAQFTKDSDSARRILEGKKPEVGKIQH
ncbi:MAG TPA: hypothetical protein VEZ90_14330 [Blastocatellia bacterium]|nr:hypothetical protein [Blastocatellia bacterium]